MPTLLYILSLAGIYLGYQGLMWLRERRRRQRAMDLLDFDQVLRDMIAANKADEQE